MVGRLFVGFVWLNLQFCASWQVDIQWGLCGSIFSFQCHGWQTVCGVRVALSLVFCVMVGRLLVGFVWLNLQFCVSWQVDFQWAPCFSIFSFLCHGWQTFSGVRVAQSLLFCVMVVQNFSGVCFAQSLVFCVMVGRLLVGFVWLNLQFSVSWMISLLVGFSFGSMFSFLCHDWQIFSGVRLAQSLVFSVMVGRLLVGFVRLNLQFSVSRLATFSGVRVAQCLVFFVMVRILLVGFVCLNLSFSASWLGDFQWGSCGSNFSFLCHGRQTFRGVRVAQSLVFCVMVGRLLGGFVWINLLFSVSWLVDFQWTSCVSIFSFLCHGWQTFSGVRVAQSVVFCVMVGRLLVGFVWLNLQISVSWQVYFQWGSCGSNFCFLCHGWQTFSGVRVAQCLVFCVMVRRFLVGFVCLNLQFSASWLVDFQWACQVLQFSVSWLFRLFSVRFVCFQCQVVQFSVSWLFRLFSVRLFSFQCQACLVFCVMVVQTFSVRLFSFQCPGRLDFSVGFVWLMSFSFLCHGWLVRGVQCQVVQFSVSWSVDFQCQVVQFSVAQVVQFSVSWFRLFSVRLFSFQCSGIFSFQCHGCRLFSVRLLSFQCGQCLVFSVMVAQTFSGAQCSNCQVAQCQCQVDYQRFSVSGQCLVFSVMVVQTFSVRLFSFQ